QAGETSIDVAFVTDGAHRVCGEEPPVPAKAAAVGALPVISAEYPGLHLRNVDVLLPSERSERRLGEIANAVIEEASSDPAAAPICYRGGQRWALEFRPVERIGPTSARLPAIRSGATYLITGGLGGIGLTIARHLAEQ